MKPETRAALKEDSKDLRARGTALIAHADRIDAVLEADLALIAPMVTIVAEEQPPVIRIRRHPSAMMTQAQACEAALKAIGRPASANEIVEHIVSHGYPVKVSNADNLRSVLSRSDDFINNGHGQWWISTDVTRRGVDPAYVSVLDLSPPNPTNGHHVPEGEQF